MWPHGELAANPDGRWGAEAGSLDSQASVLPVATQHQEGGALLPMGEEEGIPWSCAGHSLRGCVRQPGSQLSRCLDIGPSSMGDFNVV